MEPVVKIRPALECPSVEELSLKLRQQGFVYVECAHSQSTFTELADQIGVVWDSSSVRISNGSKRLFNSDAALPYHTDSPFANVVAWYCVDPGSVPVPTLILDVTNIAEHIDAEDARLLSGLPYARPTPSEEKVGIVGLQPVLYVVDEQIRLNYMGWMPIDTPTRRHQLALARLRLYIARRVDQGLPIMLRQGEALFLDNNRFMHARPRLPPATRRHLLRLWINSDGFAGVPTSGKCISPAQFD